MYHLNNLVNFNSNVQLDLNLVIAVENKQKLSYTFKRTYSKLYTVIEN